MQRTLLARFTKQRPLALRRELSTATPGRVAIVTGSARGIGRAIALRLAKDGFDLAINDLPGAQSSLKQVSDEIAQAGRRAFICPGDVSKEEDVKRLVESTAESLGSVDVMVANAGIALLGTTVDGDMAHWDKTFAVNARGVFLSYKYAAKQMVKQGKGGRIIGASSVLGKQGSSTFSAYCATKFAVRGLTQATAQELAPHGITVNAYSPGLIDTDMLKDIGAQQVSGVDDSSAMLKDKFDSLLGFNGTAEDVAGLVAYLASPDARFVTGQSISINGGIFFD